MYILVLCCTLVCAQVLFFSPLSPLLMIHFGDLRREDFEEGFYREEWRRQFQVADGLSREDWKEGNL